MKQTKKSLCPFVALSKAKFAEYLDIVLSLVPVKKRSLLSPCVLLCAELSRADQRHVEELRQRVREEGERVTAQSQKQAEVERTAAVEAARTLWQQQQQQQQQHVADSDTQVAPLLCRPHFFFFFFFFFSMFLHRRGTVCDRFVFLRHLDSHIPSSGVALI